jgi:hypothetical protein
LKKIEAAVAAGKLDPINNYHHNLILTLYKFSRDVDLRAGAEVCLFIHLLLILFWPISC